MIFNFEYCFLSDIGCGDFSKNSLRICSILPPKNVFQINEKEYKDPDMYSETLYKYHKEIWKKELPSGGKISDINNVSENNSGCKITAKVGKKNVYLGSDYIGFSKNWIPGGSDVKDIENALMKSRTFGGHILFAKGFFTGWFYCKKDKKIHYEKSNIYDWYKREYQKDDVNDMYKNLMIYTINTSKGGEKSFYDRFDWTLIMDLCQ
ncbi:DUF6994 family protein [Clostridium algidicarnis]|uniref:Uncharacterized protein n=1 Tax=Clostridium algidicarnis TaxID=37659 RepID=A0ABS6C6H0_9CLOT|nr:hypothetical protein [Clostridium algidicarnis]MBU3221084.1 hypothetical protein [Clostridium algidicarnis]